ncbi:MAG TPA: DUF3810 domain-containing protein [Moheibacter sp.]|nr:DUF3810 domain-containing protein [Moheibacter sp.]
MTFLKNYRLFRSLIVLFLSVIIVRLLGLIPRFTDAIFPKLQYFLSKILYSLSQKFPFSVGDLFYTLLAFFGLIFLIRLIQTLIKKDWNVMNQHIIRLVYFLTLFYLGFHFIWGFYYYKTPVKTQYDTENISLEELKDLAEFYYVQSVKYRKLVNEDANGVFRMELSNEQLVKAIQKSAEIIKSKYPEIKFNDFTPPNIKKSLYSTPFSYMGVSGYYVPFTIEAQYNSNMPDTKLLFTQLHETAHQWGFATENEANFAGFLLGSESEQVELNYVSNYKAMRSILNRILLVDPVYVQIMLIRYSDGMKRDRLYEKAINEKYEGAGDDAFSLMNEAFLRINNQEGLESYGRFVELLVGFNRDYSKSK